MKRKSTYLLAALAATGVLLCSTMAVASHNPTIPNKKENAAEKLLYVIEAKHSKFKFFSGKQYKLTMLFRDIKTILAFSDRPYRNSHELDPKTFHKLILYCPAN